MKAHEEHQSVHFRSGVPHGPTLCEDEPKTTSCFLLEEAIYQKMAVVQWEEELQSIIMHSNSMIWGVE
jgi:hypothetical protein